MTKHIKCYDLLLEPVNYTSEVIRDYKVDNAEGVAKVINDYFKLDRANREIAAVIGFTATGEVTGIHQVSSGGVESTTANPSQILKFLLLTNSSSFIFLHNHPSGSPEPSPQDITFSKNMMIASKLVGIKMLDHIIVTRNGLKSLSRDEDIWNRLLQ